MCSSSSISMIIKDSFILLDILSLLIVLNSSSENNILKIASLLLICIIMYIVNILSLRFDGSVINYISVRNKGFS